MSFLGSGFRLEPLGPAHNERDYAAWTSSMDHIHRTPGWEKSDWPRPMTLEDNLADLNRHAEDFASRRGFTYSILDGDEVIGCVYIYPDEIAEAHVMSWVTADRASLDAVVWAELRRWVEEDWPFGSFVYAPRT
jgi:hypothetical protein